MELTRRDALAALSAGGVVGAGVVALGSRDDTGETASDAPPEGRNAEDASGASDAPGSSVALDDHVRETLVAVARVVYPSAVTGVETFVTAYLRGKAGEAAYVSGAAETVERLDDASESWHGGRFVDLDPETRATALREIGADTADPDPGGSPAERVRYYLCNELLYALYASPTGGELVGIENPQGHPGGLTSYQRGSKA